MKTTLVPRFSRPEFGPIVHELAADWKPCSAEWTSAGMFTCFCDNKTRRRSRVFLNGNEIHTDDGEIFHNETIGPAFEWGGYIGFAGECGHLLYYTAGGIKKSFELKYANTLLEVNGMPHVFDTRDGKILVRHCLTGDTTLTMPGDGIVLQACHHKGKIYAAAADGTPGGLVCSDGSSIQADCCQCVVPYLDKLLYSSRNHIFEAGHVIPLATFDCEKIMYMRVVASKLWIAGANPDTLWCANARGEIIQVGRCEQGNQQVGGSCFRVCFALNPHGTEGYFLRTATGNQSQSIQLVWR